MAMMHGVLKKTYDGTTWTLIDIIGDPSEDPVTGWDVAGVPDATYHHTLIRKDQIITGNSSWGSSAGTNIYNSEWIVYPLDTYSFLGWHNIGG